MPIPGYVFQDSGTTPPNEAESTATETNQVNASEAVAPAPPAPAQNPLLEQKPSESHALATANRELKGAAQEAGKEADITDLGWQTDAECIPTLVGGLPNEELWTLVRRFNKVFVAGSLL
jgi:hypothetical protein